MKEVKPGALLRPFCSFCGLSSREVTKLIQGPYGHHICDKCVKVAARMIGLTKGVK